MIVDGGCWLVSFLMRLWVRVNGVGDVVEEDVNHLLIACEGSMAEGQGRVEHILLIEEITWFIYWLRNISSFFYWI